MRLLHRLCLVAMWPACAPAFEATDAVGLNVRIEDLAEPVVVDGASLLIRRATGPGTAALVERVRLRWNSQGSPTRALQSGGWRLLTRWSGDSSEVLQWRATGGDAEALHSRYRPVAGIARTGPAPFTLPANCAWGRSIAGRAGDSNYMQVSGYCKGSPETGSTGLLALLREAGWQVQARDAHKVQVTRGDHEATLVLARDSDAAGYALIWIDVLHKKSAFQ